MVDKYQILKSFNNAIIKCSNNEIRIKLGKLVQEEKLERLEGKVNPFELEDYKSLLHQLEDENRRLSEYDEGSISYELGKERINALEKKIFDYEKRIYRGYDLNKNLDNVPKYNLEDYKNDDVINETMDDVLKHNIHFGKLEQAQLDKQKSIEFDEDEEDYLFEYFRGEDTSLEINSVLDHNYGRIGDESYWDYWEHQSDLQDMREYYTNHTKYNIKAMDSAMTKSEGLLQPTVLYTGVGNSNIVSIHTRVGDKVNMKSFISTSFQEGIAQRYGKELEGDNLPNLYIKFLTPTGTKGICANDQRINDMKYFFEHEYLLDRNQQGRVVDIDYSTGCVTVLLEG